PAKLSLGEFESVTAKYASVRLTNMSDRAVTYAVSHVPALGAYTDTPNSTTVRFSSMAASVQVGTPWVTVPPRSEATVGVGVARPVSDTTGLIFGGYVTFTPTDGSPTLRVPYLGYHGDYQRFSTLDYSSYGLPWLAKLEGGSFYKMERMTINPQNGENAYLLFNLARQASKLRITARATRGRNVGRLYDLRWVGRDSNPEDFSVLAWDGRNSRGDAVPAGEYVLVLEVLRPLGDENNPAHWDTWTSGPVTVQNQ
ncbi:MAG TPA: Fn3-like domain-containing protein, partial [Symbiobacteriaceae bacterium]|nr:Fn3-like domain-containing protein [Symbiobacteriaceae bacterium]